MIWWAQISFQIFFLILIYGIIDLHAHWLDEGKRIGFWFHFVWGIIYLIPALFVGIIIYEWDWKVLLLLSLFRFSFYNPMLNRMCNKPFFYLRVGSGLWNTMYPYVWSVLFAGWILLQFFV